MKVHTLVTFAKLVAIEIVGRDERLVASDALEDFALICELTALLAATVFSNCLSLDTSKPHKTTFDKLEFA